MKKTGLGVYHLWICSSILEPPKKNTRKRETGVSYQDTDTLRDTVKNTAPTTGVHGHARWPLLRSSTRTPHRVADPWLRRSRAFNHGGLLHGAHVVYAYSPTHRGEYQLGMYGDVEVNRHVRRGQRARTHDDWRPGFCAIRGSQLDGARGLECSRGHPACPWTAVVNAVFLGVSVRRCPDMRLLMRVSDFDGAQKQGPLSRWRRQATSHRAKISETSEATGPSTFCCSANHDKPKCRPAECSSSSSSCVQQIAIVQQKAEESMQHAQDSNGRVSTQQKQANRQETTENSTASPWALDMKKRDESTPALVAGGALETGCRWTRRQLTRTHTS